MFDPAGYAGGVAATWVVDFVNLKVILKYKVGAKCIEIVLGIRPNLMAMEGLVTITLESMGGDSTIGKAGEKDQIHT